MKDTNKPTMNRTTISSPQFQQAHPPLFSIVCHYTGMGPQPWVTHQRNHSDGGGDHVGHFFCPRRGVSHSNAQPGSLNHSHIIILIT